MAGLLCHVSWLFRRSNEPRHNQARNDKSDQAHHQPFPVTERDKIETSQGNTRSQQKAA
jgi:hypothetical protein